MDAKGIAFEDVNFISLARVLTNKAVDHPVREEARDFLSYWGLVNFSSSTLVHGISSSARAPFLIFYR
jgi:hypothetical protein